MVHPHRYDVYHKGQTLMASKDNKRKEIMKSIALFNNKGGVGKTTLLCNIAAYYSQRLHQRVLVIDADPQCNATTYLLTDDQVRNLYYKEKPNTTLYDYLAAYQDSEDPKEPEIIRSEGFGVDVILGDTRVASIEDFVSSEWMDNKRIGGSLKTICFVKNLLATLENRYDYIFFDLGPSLGAINRVILLSVSGFLLPMSSDIFSLRAIENISHSLSTWCNHFNERLSMYEEQRGARFSINGVEVKATARFIGYVTQQYKAKTENGEKRPVKAYDEIISQIPDKIKHLLSGYYPLGMTDAELRVGEVPNFNSLVPMSQSSHKAIFLMDNKDGVVGSQFSKVDEYEELMKGLIEHLEINIQNI